MEKKPDGSKVYRNEKQEENLNSKNQMDQFNKYESSEGYDSSSGPEKSKQFQQGRQLPDQSAQANARRDVTQILKLRLSDAMSSSNLNKENQSKKMNTNILVLLFKI
jgi:hypothetical protein